MQAEEALVDRAQLLRLTGPEMTAAASAACAFSVRTPADPSTACFTSKPGTLTNDFFVNLLDMSTQWQPAGSDGAV